MMPSASSNTKLEKQVSGTPAESTTTDNNNATNPMKQTLVTIEHKIRNLEKRKTKLESYREIQASGKELSADQKAAVAKYDAVTHTLEFVRDLSKQMIQFSKDAEKEQKKQARKDAIIKAQTETNKIREVLVIQNILANFNDDYIRETFLAGENGAIKLELTDVDNLRKFYADIIANRPEQPDDVPFLNVAQKAAEYLSMTIDGRPKQYGDTTFENLKRLLQQIQDCGYLDKVHLVNQSDAAEEPGFEEAITDIHQEPDEEPNANDEDRSDDVAADEIPQQSPKDQQLQTKPPSNYEGNSPVLDNVYVMEAPEVASVYPAQQIHNQMPPQPTPPPTSGIAAAHTSQPPQQQQHQQIPRQVVPSPVNMQQPPVAAMPQAVTAVAAPVPGHYPATTVRAVEEAYFKHQQYLQQMRPLAEVIGGAKIYFLQDSEVDSPDLSATTFGGNPNDVQTQCTNVFNQHQGQPPTPPQQQQQHQMQLVQSPVVQQQQQQQQQQPTHTSQQPPQQTLPKGAHVNMAAPIPTQTFTNQSFPPIVQAPATLYPVAANSVATSLQSPLSCVPTDKQQMGQPVFSPAVNASPAILSVQHQMIAATNHQAPIEAQHPGAVVMMNRVNIAGYQQYEGSPVAATVQVLNPSSAVPQPTDPYQESIEPTKDETILSSTEEANTTPSSEWESNDREDRRRDNSQSKGVNPTETNQWSSEMNSAALFNSNSGGGGNQSDSSSTANSNSRKNEWSDENHHQGRQESNHWSSSSHQNDGYGGGRSRHNYNRNDQRGRDGGRGNNGMDRMDRGAMRGGNGGSAMGGGYRGRNNYPSSQSQQNGGGRGGGVYFRNNDNNSYYHGNQNGNSNNAGGSNGGGSGGGGGGGYNKESGNGQRYDNTNNYRPRSGNNNASNSGNNSRNNSNSNNGNNTRSTMSTMTGGGMNGPRTGGGRTTGGGGATGAGGGSSTYVNSRQQPNPRQPQDVA